MRFKLVITGKEGSDIETVTVVFSAPNWKEVPAYMMKIMLKIELDVDLVSAVVTYADPTKEEEEERERRRMARNVERMSGYPIVKD